MFLLEKKVSYTTILVTTLLICAPSFCSNLDHDSFAVALQATMNSPLRCPPSSVYKIRRELKEITNKKDELETEASNKTPIPTRVKSKKPHQEIPRQDQRTKKLPTRPYNGKNKTAPVTCIYLRSTAINPDTKRFQCTACPHNPWVPMSGIPDHFSKYHRDIERLPIELRILNTAYTSVRLLIIGIHYSVLPTKNPPQYKCTFCQKIYTNVNHLAGHINCKHFSHSEIMEKYEHALTQNKPKDAL